MLSSFGKTVRSVTSADMPFCSPVSFPYEESCRILHGVLVILARVVS